MAIKGPSTGSRQAADGPLGSPTPITHETPQPRCAASRAERITSTLPVQSYLNSVNGNQGHQEQTRGNRRAWWLDVARAAIRVIDTPLGHADKHLV